MRGMLAAALVLAYPLWSHAVVLGGYPRLSLAGLGALVLLSESVRAGGWPRSVTPWCAVLVIAGAAVLDLLLAWPLALYLPPVVIPLALAGLFARSLRPGRRALIEAFLREVMGERSPAKAVYARYLTAFWAMVCAALAVEAALLAVFASTANWSLMTNVVNYAIILGLFAAEFAWRCYRFGPPADPRALLAGMLHTDWRRLGVDHERG